MMKAREDRWVAPANRLVQRGDQHGWYSAAEAATLGTQMSMAAGGQVSRGGGGGGAAARSSGGTKRSGPIRPGSGTGTGGGSGSGGRGGGGGSGAWAGTQSAR